MKIWLPMSKRRTRNSTWYDESLSILTSSFVNDPLLQATNYQRKYTKRKILFLLVLLVIGMFILLLVKPKRSSQPASPPPAEPPPPAAEPPSQEQDPGGQRSDPINTLNHARPVPEVSTDHLDIVAPNEIPPKILKFK